MVIPPQVSGLNAAADESRPISKKKVQAKFLLTPFIGVYEQI
jgi:hypothetical protein